MNKDNLDPGIIFIQESLGTYCDKGHITNHNYIIEQEIIYKKVRPDELPTFAGHKLSHITNFCQQYHVE